MEAPRAGIKLMLDFFQLCGNRETCFCPGLGLGQIAAFVQAEWFMKSCPKHFSLGSLLAQMSSAKYSAMGPWHL